MALESSLVFDIGIKLAMIVARKWAIAKYGESTAEMTDAVVECFAGHVEKHAILSAVKEMSNPFGEVATIEDSARYYLSSLKPEQVTLYIDRCYHGQSPQEEASEFAQQLWLVTDGMRTMIADEKIRDNSRFEEICKDGLREAFLRVTASPRYLSDTARRIEKIVEKIERSSLQIEKKGYPHFLTDEESTDRCWHRENEINDLQGILNAKERLIMINGFGGIGKSTIVKELFHRIHERYTFAGFISYNNNLEDSINVHFNNHSFPWGDIDNNPERRLRTIYNFLQDEPGTKLLVIDNYDNVSCLKDETLNLISKKTDVTIILTSRLKRIERFTTYSVGFLNKNECVELFIRYYKDGGGVVKELDRPLIEKLIHCVHGHTLSVELLAKTACECPYQLEDFSDIVSQIGISYDDVEVQTGNTDATMKEHLKKLFDWQSLSIWGEKSEELLRILRNISLMPTVKIPAEVERWIGCKHKDLMLLDKSGWLSFDRTSKCFFMHPLVKEILLIERESYVNDIGEEFFLSLPNFIDFGKDTYIQALPKLEIADEFLSQTTNQSNGYYALACASVGSWHIQYGDFHGAQSIIEKALQLCIAVFGDRSTNYAKACDLLATVKSKLGEYAEAERLYRISIDIEENADEKEMVSIATSYNNFADLLQKIGEFEEAERLLCQGLQIYIEEFGPSDIRTIKFKESLGTFYVHQGEFEKAESLLLEVVARHEKEYGKEHPNTGISYNNMGGLYYSRERYDEAEPYFQRALEIKLKHFGEENIETARSYFNMGVVSYNLGKYKEAADYLCCAGRVQFRELGKEHPDFIATANQIFFAYLASPVIPGEKFDDWLERNIPEIKGVYHS